MIPSISFFFSARGAAVPVVESMVALVLVDQLMVQCAQGYLLSINPELQDPVPVHNNALTDFEIANVE